MNTIAWLIVILTVLAIRWLESLENIQVKKALNWFPAILLAYLIPALITHIAGIDLSGVMLHHLSRDYFIPLAVVLVMSALFFRQLKAVGSKPIILFVSGSLAIATLPALLVWITILFEPGYGETFIKSGIWKGLVPIVGGWIGGSTSQLVLKEVVECPEGLFLSVLVLDNILVNIWTILMFQVIQRSEQLNDLLKIKSFMPDFIAEESPINSPLRSLLITSGLAVSSMLAINLITDDFLWKIIILSLLGLTFGNLIPSWDHRLALKAGSLLIVTIMAILGLKLNFAGLSLPGIFVTVVVIWLILHYLIMMFTAWCLRVHMAWVPIASMANLGGISTAPAVTAAYQKEWMPHAILLAILSMVTGTAWGLFTIFLFNLF